MIKSVKSNPYFSAYPLSIISKQIPVSNNEPIILSTENKVPFKKIRSKVLPMTNPYKQMHAVKEPSIPGKIISFENDKIEIHSEVNWFINYE